MVAPAVWAAVRAMPLVISVASDIIQAVAAVQDAMHEDITVIDNRTTTIKNVQENDLQKIWHALTGETAAPGMLTFHDSTLDLSVSGKAPVPVNTSPFAGYTKLGQYLNALMMLAPPTFGLDQTVTHTVDGTGQIAVNGATVAVRVDFDDIPEYWGRRDGEPARWDFLGEVSFGILGGWRGYQPLHFERSMFYPLPYPTTHLRYAIRPALTATIRQYLLD